MNLQTRFRHHWRESLRRLGYFLLVAFVLVTALESTLVSVAEGKDGLLLAQAPDLGFEDEGGGWFQWNSWPFELTMVLLVFLLAVIFGLFGLFAPLLRKRQPTWPKTAYGISAFVVLLVTTVAVTGFFWEDLVIGGQETVGVQFWYKYGPKLLVTGVGLALAFLMLFVFRSSHRRAAA